MQALVSRSIPAWVPRSVEHACASLCVRHSEILESPRSGRWDIVVELEDGAEVLAWVDRFDQTPARVMVVMRQALEDAGVTVVGQPIGPGVGEAIGR